MKYGAALIEKPYIQCICTKLHRLRDRNKTAWLQNIHRDGTGYRIRFRSQNTYREFLMDECMKNETARPQWSWSYIGHQWNRHLFLHFLSNRFEIIYTLSYSVPRIMPIARKLKLRIELSTGIFWLWSDEDLRRYLYETRKATNAPSLFPKNVLQLVFEPFRQVLQNSYIE